MAKKNPKSAAAKITAAKTSTPAPESVTTAVRNTAVPPKTAAIAAPTARKSPTYHDVELRAYFIWKSSGGNQFDNWIRAERELSI